MGKALSTVTVSSLKGCLLFCLHCLMPRRASRQLEAEMQYKQIQYNISKKKQQGKMTKISMYLIQRQLKSHNLSMITINTTKPTNSPMTIKKERSAQSDTWEKRKVLTWCPPCHLFSARLVNLHSEKRCFI